MIKKVLKEKFKGVILCKVIIKICYMYLNDVNMFFFFNNV